MYICRPPPEEIAERKYGQRANLKNVWRKLEPTARFTAIILRYDLRTFFLLD